MRLGRFLHSFARLTVYASILIDARAAQAQAWAQGIMSARGEVSQASILIEADLAEMMMDIRNNADCGRTRRFLDGSNRTVQWLSVSLDANSPFRRALALDMNEADVDLLVRLKAAVAWHGFYMSNVSCQGSAPHAELRPLALKALTAAHQMRRLVEPPRAERDFFIASLLRENAIDAQEAERIRTVGDSEETLGELLREGGQRAFPVRALNRQLP